MCGVVRILHFFVRSNSRFVLQLLVCHQITVINRLFTTYKKSCIYVKMEISGVFGGKYILNGLSRTLS